MKNIIIGMLMSIGLTSVYAQDSPVLEYDNSRDKVNLIDASKLSTKKNEQRQRIAALTEELQKKDIYRHRAENLVNDKGRPIGTWAPSVTDDIRMLYDSLITNAKPTGGRLKAVYKVKGSDGKIKEVLDWYDVYTTGEITPWITRDVHEMWDKLPCNRELKRFYMSDALWHVFNPKGLEKLLKETVSRGVAASQGTVQQKIRPQKKTNQ